MDLWHVILEILALLGTAFALGAIAERFGQSSVIGYLLAGVVLGPFIPSGESVRSLAELGVALLLFSIGLEFSWPRLRSLGHVVFGGGIAQILGTTVVFAAILMVGLPLAQAVCVGAVIALSSTAVVLRVLTQRTELETIHGRGALGVLLLQDVALVPLVLLVTILSEGGSWSGALVSLARAVAAAALMAGLFYVLFNRWIPRVLLTPGVARSRELVVLLAIVVALAATWVSHAVGLSPALGAFLAGVMLAESPFALQIRADVGAMRTLFVTLFFTSIGLLADPVWTLRHAPVILATLAVVFVGKAAIGAAALRLFAVPTHSALAAGICLGQVGEFSFVLATIAHKGALLSDDALMLIVTVTIASLFAAPYMVAYADPLARRLLGRGAGVEPPPPGWEAPEVLVVGFGPAGQAVARELRLGGSRVGVMEQNPASVARARREGYDAHLGDASTAETLEHAGLGATRCVVVTLPDPKTAQTVIALARRFAPRAAVVARARYHIYRDRLEAAGAHRVTDEEVCVGETLAREAAAVLSGARE